MVLQLTKELSAMLKDVCKRHGCKFFVVPLQYAGDCGSQICWTGLLESQVKEGVLLKDTFVTQSWRLDSVKVFIEFLFLLWLARYFLASLLY